MRRFRRRRRNGTWFPVFAGQYTAGTGGTFNPAGIGFAFSNVVEGNNLAVSALTYDEPREPGAVQTSTTSLLDVLGEEWFLKRIVGKFNVARFVDPANDPATDAGPPVLACLGFFVARADQTTPNVPNGFNSLTQAEVYAQYNPLAAQTQREPWLFRRTWLLGGNTNGQQIQNVGGTNFVFPTTLTGAFPSANWQFPGTFDGPHLDIRTRRRISSDDRLYAAFAVEAAIFGISAVVTTNVTAFLDYRIFGSPRRPRNRGNF